MADDQTITIDGTEYKVADLSDEAKAQIANIRATDREIGRLRALLAMCQTARTTYFQALKAELDTSASA